MKIKLIVLSLGLLFSPLGFADSTCLPEHEKMGHCTSAKPAAELMDHSQHTMPVAKPATKPAAAMDHSQHQMAIPKAASSCSPEHEKMGHCKSDKPSIPVSDGAMAENIPMPFPGTMHMVDDPVLTKVMIDRFEIINADGDKPILLEADAWIGKDLNKLWLKTEIERVGSETEEAELQVLYSRAISPYWDIQAGLRKDFKPEEREWAALSLKGLSPYYFDVDASLFIGEGGRTAARLQGEYELMLTQKAILIPEVELNFYGQDDPAIGIGSGLSDANVSLRFQYEFKREFAPYIGVTWSKMFGDTADFAREEGEDTSDAQVMVGFSAWF